MNVKNLKETDKAETLVSLKIPLTPSERHHLDAVCGPGRKDKRGQWVREAILEKLEREERARRQPA